MAELIWSPQALDDVEAACLYIARDSPRFAELFADRIFRAVEQLMQFPLSGRVVPEISREDYREIPFQSYRIVYRLVGDDVEIVTVHHSARQLGDPTGPAGERREG